MKCKLFKEKMQQIESSEKKLRNQILYAGLANLVTSNLVKLMRVVSLTTVFFTFIYFILGQTAPMFYAMINSFLFIVILIVFFVVTFKCMKVSFTEVLKNQLTVLLVNSDMVIIRFLDTESSMKLSIIFLLLWLMIKLLNRYVLKQVRKQWETLPLTDFEKYWTLKQYTRTESIEQEQVSQLISSEEWRFKYGGVFFISQVKRIK